MMLPEDFDAIKLKLASPQEIISWSHGEVTKPETINYRTQRPEKDGLFSERIFGPTKDWECYCGKYKRIRYKGIICDKCGVEVTRSSVRRERMGHIALACPVAHIWFLKNIPSQISLFLGVSQQQLERVIYYSAYIITDVNKKEKKKLLKELQSEYQTKKKKTEQINILENIYKYNVEEINKIEPLKIISEAEYFNLSKKYGHIFEAGIGSEPIVKLLKNIDLKKRERQLMKEFKTQKGDRKKVLLQLKLVKSFIKNNLRPEWMFLNVLPVLPPDLRPMVALDGGRYATSDLNDLYRRVINRNNRLKKLLELNAPEVIIRNEKRMLQEAVDSLIDNSARKNQIQSSAQKRPLKSLTDILQGKQGRFRQNLLGKRVDYSGRSVIVVGPDLKHYECGIPKTMALELFRPFVVNKLLERGVVFNIRNANRLIDQGPAEVWAILEEVIKDRFVLLNRAPTLHRLGIQAFKPVLIEDLAIRIPPMVCTAFNADFDGDQMAVHLPLTKEAQKEAEEIMLSSRNLLKPANGEPIVNPTKDIILGCYYLTKIFDNLKGEGKVFSSPEEAMLAYDNKIIDLKAKIKIKPYKENYLKQVGEELIAEKYNNPDDLIEVSVGKIIFNEIFPKDFPFVSNVIEKKFINKLTDFIINYFDTESAIEMMDKIKEIGFNYATISGITWSMNDLIIPKEKEEILKETYKEVETIEEQLNEGLLSKEEKKIHVIQAWEKSISQIQKNVPKALSPENSVYQIIDSGSRGSWAQLSQMMGMKGLVQSPKGEIIELPILSSYKEGLSVLEYFIASHGARKGSSDTALRTANAGYLTRRLIDATQDLIITEDDCKTNKGIMIKRGDGLEFGQRFRDKIVGRTSLEDIKIHNKIIVKANEIINSNAADLIENSDIQELKVRSPITCKTLWGVCAKCYGYDLAYNKPVALGTPVGVVAAQSIGEPGTQLTLRTFHSGGVAGEDITHGLPRIEELFECRNPKHKAIISEINGKVIKIEEQEKEILIEIKADVNKEEKNKDLKRTTKKLAKKEIENIIDYSIPKNKVILVKEGDKIMVGQKLCVGDIDLKELLKVTDKDTVERYILNEVQKIYIFEGVLINNKHIEVVIRQMFDKVRIKNPGDSEFLVGEVVSKSKFIEENNNLKNKGKKPARAVQLFLGITRSALFSESFLSAASFQETTRGLVNAAIEGKVDYLRGLKENVIIGRLIPAGTAFRKNDQNQKEQKKKI
ncbi:MAG TPA: DNA-directed RNA polymerase subunit beta' [Candidatus Paceibacterota bacterium]|nr:DNA-directed RNA polymerase subunit beta' [Candidatus Paceibacterota bacterium]HPC37444.1 DNA-directed RNA polymerase subunit beta' [Candidatus Paceibacterota bacterium]